MKDEPDDKNELTLLSELRKEMAKSELRRINLIALASAVLFGYTLILLVFFEDLVEPLLLDSASREDRFVAPGCMALLLVYSVSVRSLVRRIVVARRELPSAYRWGTVAFEAAFPTLVLVLVGRVADPIFLLVSPVVLGYGIFIFSPTLQLDPKTPVFASLVAAVGYLGAYLTYRSSVDPANYTDWLLSWADAARFANWLHNGQPIGAQDLTTTEDGSYFLNGTSEFDVGQLEDVTREPDATWVIPSEDGWYKAAYHKNDGVTGSYWTFPTGADNGVSNTRVDPDPGNHATYSVPIQVYTIGAPHYRTEVGAHENSASAYGTFDQGGNVHEFKRRGARF